MSELWWGEYDGDWQKVAQAIWRWTTEHRPDIVDLFPARLLSDEEVKEMEKNGMISLDNTPPEDETKCASEDQLEEHACKRFSDCACQAKAKSESAEALKAFRDGGCCGN